MIRRHVAGHAGIRRAIRAAMLCCAVVVGAEEQGSALWTMGGQNPQNTRHAPTERRIGVHNAALAP